MAEICIIVPSYNQGKFISDTLDSIRSQTFTDWELIVIDSSTDNTPEIIHKYLEMDKPYQKTPFNSIDVLPDVTMPFIKKYIRVENTTMGDKLNIGFKLTDAKYLTWLASDDLWKPTYLQTMIDLIEKQNADLVYSSFDFSSTDLKLETKVQVKATETYETLKNEGCIYIFWLFTKALYEEIGDFISALGEDYDFTLKCAYLNKKMIGSTESLAICRNQKDRASNRASNVNDINKIKKDILAIHEKWVKGVESGKAR